MRLILSLLLVMTCVNVFSQKQPRKISGLVTSQEDRSPIEGVAVKAKVSGNTSGTQADGVYYISLSPRDSVLIFSYPGYKTIEVAIGDSSQKDISLSRDDNHTGVAILFTSSLVTTIAGKQTEAGNK